MIPSQITPRIYLDLDNPNLSTEREYEALNTKSSSNHPASSMISSSSVSSQPSKFKVISQLYEETQLMVEEEVCHLTEEELESMYESLKESILKAAMDEEINQITKNNTWSLVIPTESFKSIGLK